MLTILLPAQRDIDSCTGIPITTRFVADAEAEVSTHVTTVIANVTRFQSDSRKTTLRKIEVLADSDAVLSNVVCCTVEESASLCYTN